MLACETKVIKEIDQREGERNFRKGDDSPKMIDKKPRNAENQRVGNVSNHQLYADDDTVNTVLKRVAKDIDLARRISLPIQEQ